MALKWGIAGAGKISHDFVTALNIMPDNHQVVAVAARSQKSAENFANQHGITKAYEGYKELALDKNIDVVYVGTVNPTHNGICKLMMENKKHVLCEKPLGMNQKEIKEMIECAQENQVFFMEAIWSRCFPIYVDLRRHIDANAIGDVLYVYVAFGVPLQEVDRVSKKELGGGTILDIGIYVLQLQQYVFKGLKPIKIVANGHLNKDGVDESANAIITYPEGKTAVISCNGRVELANEATIVGTKGTIRIESPFWCPTIMSTPKKTINYTLPESSANFNFKNSSGLLYEAEHVKFCIDTGLLESPIVPHSDSLELGYLMDKMRKDVGVIYDQDR